MFATIRTRSLLINRRTVITASALLSCLALAACGGPSASRTSSGGPALPASTTASAPSSSVVDRPSAPPAATSGTATLTTPQGYALQIGLTSPGISAVPTFTTDDGSGLGDTAVDAPPGYELMVAKLTVTNATDRAEPLALVGIGPLPETASSQVTLAVPVSDAAAFDFSAMDVAAHCGTPGNDPTAPVGYCSLITQTGAFSPAQDDITKPPQLAPGQTGSLTLIGNSATIGVPQSAPLSAVKAFVLRNDNCDCWAPLS